MILSECCGMPIWMEGDPICTQCGEHTEAWDEENNQDGDHA